MTMFAKCHPMGGALGVATGLDSVAFSPKPSGKKKKCFLISPYNVTYFDLVLNSRFKTKRSLRSDVNQSITEI